MLYLSGDLPYEEHQAAEAHLDECGACTAMLMELSQKPEQRAGIAAVGGGFQAAVTERLPIQTNHREKIMWLERHYKLQIGDVIDSKYRIERVLGEGGMGIVLLATHLGLRDKVALKFMHPSMVSNATHAARFIREARAAVKLRNENVARVLDLGEIPDTGPFIVMEYLEGRDMLEYLKKNAPLPIGECVELIRQAAAGVTAAHSAGIIHRDLKPGNMFLTDRQDGSRVLKVLDFGVSKYIEGDSLSMTGTNMVVGSPMYMAPEMFESARNASFSSDVWAIGVIFYRMLTGRLPFYAESLPEMVAKIHFSKPTPLVHWRPGLPIEIVQIVEACLARDPAQRFASAREFSNALSQLPQTIASDQHVPSMSVGHLTATGGDRAPIETLPGSSPARPVALEAPGKTGGRSPWLFALVGAAMSAALFAVIMAVSSNDEPAPQPAASETEPPPPLAPAATSPPTATAVQPAAAAATPASPLLDAGPLDAAPKVTEIPSASPDAMAETKSRDRRKSTRKRRVRGKDRARDRTAERAEDRKTGKPESKEPAKPDRPEDDLLLP